MPTWFVVWAAAATVATIAIASAFWAIRREDASSQIEAPPAGLRTRREVLRGEGVSIVGGGVIPGTGAIAEMTIDVAAGPSFPALQCSTDRLRVRRVEVANLRSGWSRTTSVPADAREGGWDHGD